MWCDHCNCAITSAMDTTKKHMKTQAHATAVKEVDGKASQDLTLRTFLLQNKLDFFSGDPSEDQIEELKQQTRVCQAFLQKGMSFTALNKGSYFRELLQKAFPRATLTRERVSAMIPAARDQEKR